MKKWFIADTHFSHANIIKYSRRPFENVGEMNCVLIENWNQKIEEEDQVFFLGDFSMGTLDHLRSICSQLKGNKICIRGNHDRNSERMHTIGFKVVLESAFLKMGSHYVELIHIPTQKPNNFQLHGHVHEKRPNALVENQLNVSVEVWEYCPVSEKNYNPNS